MSEIPKYLELIREHKYPLIKDYFSLPVNSWEENLLFSRRTRSPELQTLLDQHLISIIWATRLGVFNPRDFAKREVDYRTFGGLPPTTRFFEWSMIAAYDEMIEMAGKQGLSDNADFLGVLKGQFDQILRTTGLLRQGEMGDVLRDVLSSFQRYQPGE